MTAKDQANNMIKTILGVRNDLRSNVTVYFAKQYANIIIDQIIQELDSERVFERIYFWNEVKEEINKL